MGKKYQDDGTQNISLVVPCEEVRGSVKNDKSESINTFYKGLHQQP